MTKPPDYDAELWRHNEVLRRVAGVRPGDHVLDIGCGAGQTTRQAARAARAGSALGIDVSVTALQRARELARAEGLGNVTFEQADAQVHPLPRAHFDLAISRFGTMFFADPAAAFTTIGRALRPGGRLAMMVWQAREHNEWDVAIRRALGADGGPEPFSLADPATVRGILAASGFTGVDFHDVREPVHYGPDVATALDFIHRFTCTTDALRRLDPDGAAHAVERLRRTLTEHLHDDGVRFDSRAWIVTARRPAS